MKFLPTVLLSTLALPLFNTAQASQPETIVQRAQTGVIYVLVTQDDRPARNAKVMLYGNGGNLKQTLKTNRYGRVAINGLMAPGSYTMQAKTRMGTSTPKTLALRSDIGHRN
ncbi:hypothetical protein [Parendozoicomonas haliclonae]|uniref:Carboxypeptidase regulatory-like domain-containing protein n=1 Tax=Parendozoicomonas haliclonae TaxID=1960125 RepID=A0A1X7ALL0_9GAMM|nr:hypothetical protein [Parendozoicomonas haliclonae]SMA48486.1 hypothetical protein EHSB41UT_02760 [Parendozoicomonas haliclonae]